MQLSIILTALTGDLLVLATAVINLAAALAQQHSRTRLRPERHRETPRPHARQVRYKAITARYHVHVRPGGVPTQSS